MKNKTSFTFAQIQKGTTIQPSTDREAVRRNNVQLMMHQQHLHQQHLHQQHLQKHQQHLQKHQQHLQYLASPVILQVPEVIPSLPHTLVGESNKSNPLCGSGRLFPSARRVKGISPLPLILVYNITISPTLIQLPLSSIKGELIIDWGDAFSSSGDTLVHTYASLGIYTITVKSKADKATVGRIGCDIPVKGIQYLLSLESWGDFNTVSLEKAFAGAKNLIKVPNDLPTNENNEPIVITMRGMFHDTNLFNHDISQWDVSSVNDMSSMFYCARRFNQDIGQWDIKNVKNSHGMFAGASNFKQDLSHWAIL